jgi:hypothetical protein
MPGLRLFNSKGSAMFLGVRQGQKICIPEDDRDLEMRLDDDAGARGPGGAV